MTTGQRIKNARKRAGFTQAQLAEKLNIPYQSISQWERNLRKPKAESLQKISNALLIPVSELLDPVAFNAGYEDGFNAADCEHRIIDEAWKQDGYSGSDIEGRLISAFSSLNDDGQAVAVERIEELTQIAKYQRTQPDAKVTHSPEESNEN